MKAGNSGRPVFAPSLIEVITDAWLIGSVELSQSAVRSGTLLLSFALHHTVRQKPCGGAPAPEARRPQGCRASATPSGGSGRRASPSGYRVRMVEPMV